jgi:hypothetical protein
MLCIQLGIKGHAGAINFFVFAAIASSGIVVYNISKNV